MLLLAVAALGGCGGSARPADKPAAKKATVVTDTVIELLPPIRFIAGSAELAPTSTATLDAIAESLIGNPDIRRLAVQVRIFDSGMSAAEREKLADRRARTVVDYLILRRVEPRRLESEGWDERARHPDGEVSFLILERAPTE